MRWFGFIFAMLLASACFAGSMGYLQVGSPPPLRIRADSMPMARLVLPPLAMMDSRAATAQPSPASSSQQPSPAHANSGSPGPASTETGTSADPSQPQVPQDRLPVAETHAQQGAATVVTPEMFLRYFHPGAGHSKDAVIVFPPEFVPPRQSVNPVRSSATYSSPPP